MRDLTDAVYGSSDAAARVAALYPEDTVLWSTAVTMLETQGEAPVGFSLARLWQLRGTVVFTDNRVYAATDRGSPITRYQVLFSLFCVVRAWMTGMWLLYGVLGLLPLPFMAQRRPYVADHPWSEVGRSSVSQVRGTLECDLVALHVGSHTLQLVLSQRLPDALKTQLGLGTPPQDGDHPDR